MKSVRPLTVFTVDDSEIVHNMLSVLFAENKDITWMGHAFSLAEAHKALADKSPRVVILDIHLKEENTLGLLEHISKHYPDTMVIMLSNIATPPYRKKCRELGASHYFDKSSEMEKLSGVLRSLSAV